MDFSLPKLNKNAINFTHFPTKHQTFIFRAYEYVGAGKIAKILNTSEEKVRQAALDMGLPENKCTDIWLKKGYITIIRNLWHILPYSQLLELLEMDEQTLAIILKEEDFLDVKLSDKPICEPVYWRELTDEEKIRTAQIKEIMQSISLDGVKPFDFKYTVPQIEFSGEEIFKTRMIYAFSGLYQHAFDVDSEDFCPDEMLEAYQKLGVNGIWTQGMLSQLTEFPFAPSISVGFKDRIARMQKFAKRLSRYGMKLYLYINEPRYMPDEFFQKYPQLQGHSQDDGHTCLCTSTPEVREYLKNGIASICKAVPEIGGFFAITRSENLTNCYSHSDNKEIPCNCPRCKSKSVAEVISQTIGCMAEGAHSINPDIKFFAWSWGWNEFSEDIIRSLPKDVILISQSELDMPFNIGGVEDKVIDYSMSIIGPGERAKSEWKLAQECGLETGAKVQVSTTWEASTVPALPVFPSIEEHISNLEKENVKHILLSWTLGGYPCANIAHAAKYFYENCTIEDESTNIIEAQKDFAKAFKEFPFNIHVLYRGPQNAGPSNLLYETKTGYAATMTCFAYDDLNSWRSIYPTDVFEKQFEKLCNGWKKGLNKLSNIEENETKIMAEAAFCLFKSSLNQIRFIRARDERRFSDAITAAKDELQIAKRMLELMNKNAAIGFEAANHYYYSKGQLAEKIINCHYIIEKFEEKK